MRIMIRLLIPRLRFLSRWMAETSGGSMAGKVTVTVIGFLFNFQVRRKVGFRRKENLSQEMEFTENNSFIFLFFKNQASCLKVLLS